MPEITSSIARTPSVAAALLALAALSASADADVEVARKIEGLLVGSLIGDAAGGPVEFLPPDGSADWLPRCRDWPDGQRIDADDLRAFAAALRVASYARLRPEAAPYGPWRASAPAGTLTDDTRNKIVLIGALRAAASAGRVAPTADDLAEAYLAFGNRPIVRDDATIAALHRASFAEFEKAARWVLGDRRPGVAAPPDRLWAGLPTCCGQMTMTPLAALYAGRPREAYLACYAAVFIDVGAAKDLNSAVVAGLAEALTIPPPSDREERRAAWARIVATMRLTDPLAYRSTPFVRRPTDRWLRFASSVADRAQGSPKRLYALLETEGEARTFWEAHATIAAVFAAIEFCDHDPLAAMTLLLDYGHDTDSTAQLLGAFVGALHGPDAFPPAMRRLVADRLAEDYAEDLTDWVAILNRGRQQLPSRNPPE